MKKINPFKLIIDLFLLIIAFFSAFFLKRGHIHLEDLYVKILPIFFLAWLISIMFSSKLRESDEDEKHIPTLEPYIFSALYFAGLLSLFIFGLRLYTLSRFIVYGSLLIYFVLEIFFLSGIYLPFFRKDIVKGKRISLLLILTEFSLITTGFFLIHYIKMDKLVVSSEKYRYILMFLYIAVFITGLFTHRFQVNLKQHYFRMIYPFLRSHLIALSILSSIIFGFNIEGFSRFLIFGSIGVFAFLEICILTFAYSLKHVQKSDIPEIEFFDAPALPGDIVVNGIIKKEDRKKARKYRFPGKKISSFLVREKLVKIYLKNIPTVFNFIDNSVELDSIDIIKTEIMDTGNPYNVNILPKNYFELYVNLHELNSFRYLNKYMIEVNRILKRGGIIISKFEPMERRYYRFYNKYPNFFAKLFYFFDFLWKRVLPKLPIFKKLYFVITKGRRRVFSMAQGLGRLYYCGFEIVALTELDNFVWFVAKKVKNPLSNITPSYGAFFKQKRVGKNGKPIYIYKMRTMHPYSEFIHKYIYDRNRLDEKGKIKDDFRITSWGRIFRKLWIDELPMLINWIKRDVKLIGIRPLSETFYNTYPTDLKKERIKCRPGLIPRLWDHR